MNYPGGREKQILFLIALSRAPVFSPSETDSDSFVDVYHTVSTLQKDPDPILAPLIEAAKADTDYQMIIQALSKFKNPKSLPFTHPGRQLNSVWTQLGIDDSLGLMIIGFLFQSPKDSTC